MDDLGGGVDADWEHVANAIGHDHLAASLRVKSRPVAKESGTETVLTIQHRVPAVGVASERQWQVRLHGGVEGVRMMRQQNGESIGLASLHQFVHLESSGVVAR